ncbi:PDR/VanB family oxidoreductase [Streptomyces sp. VRA16 Mangrove soil]|uniref:PDR/VanB family oxidoreductase n=1 Tax=Streptomyces sp. VRA16 Mangrove soil TaxID=2817434 RepID=UPI001A9F9CED|nr:PDR/VanB family oxidoreductase [Streptomyces sp. VRA16 Mangrove soil]MBO1330653.1 oxidoreductase [Streptomyces sp. VRA16 Mangrove soil]
MSELIDLVVAERRQEAVGVVSLLLRRPDGGPLPGWEPGAHVDLLLGDGLERQYSLCGGDASAWRIAVLREEAGRGGSAHVHGELTEGSAVRARGPRNHFPLEPASAYRFVAGGIGITPILPMLHEADAPWSLYYGGRALRSMAFTAELAARHPADRLHLQEGLLDLPAALADLRPGELVYACGPEPLLTAVEALVPPGALRTERFTAVATDTAADEAFEIELALSGRTLTVPADRSVLATLQDAGIDVLYSCTEGTCGTCETDVLAGEVDHRDSVLTTQEQARNETMMVCVSRAVKGGRLTLDL